MTKFSKSTVKMGLVLGAVCFAGCGEMETDVDPTTASDSAIKKANRHKMVIKFSAE